MQWSFDTDPLWCSMLSPGEKHLFKIGGFTLIVRRLDKKPNLLEHHINNIYILTVFTMENNRHEYVRC